MKKIYLALLSLALSGAAMAQTVSIGTSTLPPVDNDYRSPWSPVYGYSYVQTIYLQPQINVAGSITSIRFKFNGLTLKNSNQISVFMGTSNRTTFASDTDWEPYSNLTEVYAGTLPDQPLNDWITINLTTPYDYQNNGSLIIAVDENKPGYDYDEERDFDAFEGTDFGTLRTIYFVDDDENPDPSNPPEAHNRKNFVGNIQIVFGTLPVTLGNFSGEIAGSANKLSWTTHSEQKNKGFELQRSADGTSFSSLGFVTSKAQSGTSNNNLTYNFNDVKPLRGNNYYRLKQLDLDGKSVFSKVVMLKGSSTKGGLSVVYPNPTKNDLNLILSSPGNDKATIYVTNVSGTIVFKTTKSVIAGDNKINVNAAPFAAGIYTVKAVYASGSESAISKFVKQ